MLEWKWMGMALLLLMAGAIWGCRVRKAATPGSQGGEATALRIEIKKIQVSLESVYYKDVHLLLRNEGPATVRPGALRLSWPDGAMEFREDDPIPAGDSLETRVRVTFASGDLKTLTRESLTVRPAGDAASDAASPQESP